MKTRIYAAPAVEGLNKIKYTTKFDHILCDICSVNQIIGPCLVFYLSTPDQSKSGSACHMTRSANHHQLVFKSGGGIRDLGQKVFNW